MTSTLTHTFFTKHHKLGGVQELFSRHAMCICSLTRHKHVITTTQGTMTREPDTAGLLFTNTSQSKRMIQASEPLVASKHTELALVPQRAHHWFPLLPLLGAQFVLNIPPQLIKLYLITAPIAHSLPYQPNSTSTSKICFPKSVFSTAEFNCVLFVPSMPYSISSSHFSNCFQEGGYTSSRTCPSGSSKEIGT